MLRKRLSVGMGVLGTAATAMCLFASTAQADYAPSFSDVVGVGSDTVQAAADFAADGDFIGHPGYNTLGNVNRFISFDATADANTRLAYGAQGVGNTPTVPGTNNCAPGTGGTAGTGNQNSTHTGDAPCTLNPTIVIRAGLRPIQRPNGSGAGFNLLKADTDPTTGLTINGMVDFARASSARAGGVNFDSITIGNDPLAILKSATSKTLAISGSPTTTGSAATLTATVAPSAAAGTVAFYDNGSTTPLTGTASNPTAGTYVLDLPSGFTAGGHSIVAKFSPTTVTQYQASQSAPSAFITQNPVVGACAQPGSVCTNTDYIQATVPVGTLVLSTPYVDAAHALDLDTLALNGDSTQLNGQATFQNIKVTDTRSGNLPWTLTALASNLTDGGSNPNSVINNQNLGLTGITSAPGTGFTGTLTPVDNPAAAAVAPGAAGSLGLGGTTAHTIATADHGLGTVTMQAR